MKAAVFLTLFLVIVQLAWNVYQDFPSVTGFTDHTVECK